MYISSHWVELGELVTMETVVVAKPAESRGAVGHALEFLLIHCLGLHIIVVDVIT